MTIKIYTFAISPRASAVQMTAEIIKLNYETQDINLMTGEHRKPEYLEKNPLHTVPLLEEDDFLLADSHAIITYLVSKYGGEHQEKLYPSDLKLRATVDQRLYFETANLTAAARDIVITLMAGEKTISTKQTEALNDAYSILDKYLEKTEFVAGDHLTVADVSLVAAVSAADAMVPVDGKYTKVHAWWNMLKEEDWYKKVNAPALAQYEGFIKAIKN